MFAMSYGVQFGLKYNVTRPKPVPLSTKLWNELEY